MRVEVHPADLGGCGHYRMIWPGQAVDDAEIFDDVKVWIPGSEPIPIPVLMQETAGRHEVRGVGDYDWPDVMVFQRPLNYVRADVIEHIQAAGCAVVVEVDDNFSEIDPQNIAFKHCHPSFSPETNWAHLERACEQADWVTVSTPALAEKYGRHGRVSVLPNYVPAKYLTTPIPESSHTIGWSGSIASHPGDIEVVGNSVAKFFQARPDASFAVVGTGVGIAKRLGIVADVRASGWVGLNQYPMMMAEIDVMTVPLKLSKFNEAKSWLKGLEAASLGSAVVASPTQQYRELMKLGLCSIAETPLDWKWALIHAANEAFDRRQESAETSRDIIRSKRLIIEERADMWAEAWTAARERRSQCTLKSKISFRG